MSYHHKSLSTGRRSSLGGVAMADVKENFKVVVRIRPSLDREFKARATKCVTCDNVNQTVTIVKPSERRPSSSKLLSIDADDFGQRISLMDKMNSHSFTYDCVFDPGTTQRQLYEACVREVPMSVLQGYNGSIIAYGQTGTGKTYTIEGESGDEARGIIPRASEHIFDYIQNQASSSARFLVRCSYLEIYNEKISDLIDPTRKDLRIREDAEGSVYVENLSEHVVRSLSDVRQLMKKGGTSRTTDSTRLNTVSSRSHAVFTIVVEHSTTTSSGSTLVTVGKLKLVDLAGSERFEADAKYKHQEETKNINLSLYMFGKVVLALTTPGTTYIPYRDSKLTRMLQDSLGGNCKTTLITTISPMSVSFPESLSSLKFAKRAKAIKNKAVVNQDERHQAMLSVYEKEIKRLKSELASTRAGLIERVELERLAMEKRKIEEEKDVVLSELYAQQREINTVMVEKERYEGIIRELETQVLLGGHKIEETPEFQQAIEKEQNRLKKEAAQTLAELQAERTRLESERAEFERERNQFMETLSVRSAPDGEPEEEARTSAVMNSKSLAISSTKTDFNRLTPAPPSTNKPSHRTRRITVGGSHSPTGSNLGVTSGGWLSHFGASYSQAPLSPFQAKLQRKYSFGGANSSAVSRPHTSAGYFGQAVKQSSRSHSVHGYYPSRLASSTGNNPNWYPQTAWDESYEGVQAASGWLLPDEESLRQYALALSHPVSGIPTQASHNDLPVFSGDAAAQWFVANMEGVENFGAAQDVGQRLMDLEVFMGLTGSSVFLISDMEFYKFAYQYQHQLHRRATSLSGIQMSSEATSRQYQLTLQDRSTVLQSIEGSQVSLASLTTASELNSRTNEKQRGIRSYTAAALESHKSSPEGSSFSVRTAVSSKTSMSSNASIDAVFEGLGWTDYKSSALHMAAGRGERSKVSKLVKQHGVNYQDSKGRTPLMYAVVTGQAKCCQLLIRHDADVNAVDRHGWSALLYAIHHCQDEVLKHFLKYPLINLQCCDEEGQNVFHHSCILKTTKCLEMLLQCSAALKAINKRNVWNETALHVAVKYHHSEHLRLLLLSNAELSVSDGQGRTALHVAVTENALTSIQAILEIKPGEMNLIDLNGQSALHLACFEGTIEAVSLLLANRCCSIDMRDSCMKSALHLAAQNSRADIVEVLLQRGFQVMVKDADGKNPLQYALEQGDSECVQLLQRATQKH
ncbi:uncharacterized protein LOC134184072 isoform X2 [Corticium candelabrum]|uniref:uncharacterized protein LOC134184072 isoform X2 n=1 Tax=Corticium candelabrum TaxID=121492 RepID=UPI002E3267B0|nr:uncharacterized protein LOC134184072 isoform X2 [Corticium candelabrum]